MKFISLPLGNGIFVKLDVEDLGRLGMPSSLHPEDDLSCVLSKAGWNKCGGYVRRQSSIGSTGMHRVVMGLSDLSGNRLEGYELLVVDHIDGDKFNNTRENLRLATNRMNAQNTPEWRDLQALIKAVEGSAFTDRGSAFRAYTHAYERRVASSAARRKSLQEDLFRREEAEAAMIRDKIMLSKTPFMDVFVKNVIVTNVEVEDAGA